MPVAHRSTAGRSAIGAAALRVAARTWPLPALLGWGAGWGICLGLGAASVPAWLAVIGAAALLAAFAALVGTTPWRRLFIGSGFPLSLVASGLGAQVPAWSWLLPLALLGWLYPPRTWRDAPLFPTPAGALAVLPERVVLAKGARILDAGCGLGAGIAELHRAYPAAELTGLEWSWPLRLACAWHCRYASVHRADIWAADWSGFELVYLFQRPESMPRAAVKAGLELQPGAWLASLAFEAESLHPTHVLDCADGRRVWLYQAPLRVR